MNLYGMESNHMLLCIISTFHKFLMMSVEDGLVEKMWVNHYFRDLIKDNSSSLDVDDRGFTADMAVQVTVEGGASPFEARAHKSHSSYWKKIWIQYFVLNQGDLLSRNCEVSGEVGYHIGHSRFFSARLNNEGEELVGLVTAWCID